MRPRLINVNGEPRIQKMGSYVRSKLIKVQNQKAGAPHSSSSAVLGSNGCFSLYIATKTMHMHVLYRKSSFVCGKMRLEEELTPFFDRVSPDPKLFCSFLAAHTDTAALTARNTSLPLRVRLKRRNQRRSLNPSPRRSLKRSPR